MGIGLCSDGGMASWRDTHGVMITEEWPDDEGIKRQRRYSVDTMGRGG